MTLPSKQTLLYLYPFSHIQTKFLSIGLGGSGRAGDGQSRRPLSLRHVPRALLPHHRRLSRLTHRLQTLCKQLQLSCLSITILRVIFSCLFQPCSSSPPFPPSQVITHSFTTPSFTILHVCTTCSNYFEVLINLHINQHTATH